jgi:hypothetical protein
MSTEGKQSFKYLKEHGDSTAQEVAKGTNINFDIVVESLDAYVKSGFLGFDSTTGKYRVKFPLDPTLKNEPTESKYWSYDRIKEKQKENQKEKLAGGGAPPLAPGVPRRWRDPNLKYLPKRIDQGGRGSCTGFAGAIEETLKYYKLTGDFPTQAEVDAELRNVSVDLGCANGKPFIRDIFNKRWKSPQFIYEMGRITGNVTAPSGGYVSAVAESLKIYGSVFETECNTSKAAECVDKWYPRLSGETYEQAQARIIKSGRNHLTKGFAQTTSFETICEALYTHGYGCVLLPINIYENYTSQGCTGNYPEIRGEVVGSHAQAVVGYDLDAGTLEFRQSWGTDWSDEGGISRRYYDEAAGAAFIILDDEETAIGKQLYTKVTVSANVPCNYTINNELHTFVDNTVMLERDVKHTVVATPIDITKVVESYSMMDIIPTGDTGSVVFTFTIKPDEPPAPPVTPSIIDLILEILKRIWEILIMKK